MEEEEIKELKYCCIAFHFIGKIFFQHPFNALKLERLTNIYLKWFISSLFHIYFPLFRLSCERRQKHLFRLSTRDLINFVSPRRKYRRTKCLWFYHRWMVDLSPSSLSLHLVHLFTIQHRISVCESFVGKLFCLMMATVENAKWWSILADKHNKVNVVVSQFKKLSNGICTIDLADGWRLVCGHSFYSSYDIKCLIMLYISMSCEAFFIPLANSLLVIALS